MLALLVGAIAVLANFSQIAQWLEIKPPQLTSQSAPQEIIDELISDSDSLILPFGADELGGREEECKKLDQNIKAAKCWTILGRNYATVNNYRKAFFCLDRAFEADARVADPFFERGETYFELAILDLVKKRRFTVSPQEISCSIAPDERSKVLFKKTLEEFSQAEKLPLIKEYLPDEENVTTLYMIGHRKKQIQMAFEGSSSIPLHKLDMMKVWMLVPLYVKDEELTKKVSELNWNLLDYMKHHPDEFPHIFPPGFWEHAPPLPPRDGQEAVEGRGDAEPSPTASAEPSQLTEEQLKEARELLLLTDIMEKRLGKAWNDDNDFGVQTEEDRQYTEGAVVAAKEILPRLRRLPQGDYTNHMAIAVMAYVDVGKIRLGIGQPGGDEIQQRIIAMYDLKEVEPHLRAWTVLEVARKYRNLAAQELGVPAEDFSKKRKKSGKKPGS
ncbi:MAG: hypothetical protein JOZ96_07145 [Acidobacteria bacterium]|nr:hypothetical protein [Acidobacteriota bacterium]